MNNLDMMKSRLDYLGGNQQGRMIKGKRDAFKRALLYSYQAAEVAKDGQLKTVKALINPDKTKLDYDDKIISVDYSAGFKNGDIFKWVGTDSYWIIYLQALTELSYFRAEIRRCRYQIKWVDEETRKLQMSWCHIRGPVETKINSIQKNGISVDVPNWSLELYLPRNQTTDKAFKERYTRFMFNDKLWEVQAVDSISMDGVLQVIALESFVNKQIDDVENNIADAYIVKPRVEIHSDEIQGNTFIKPRFDEHYSCLDNRGEWSVLEKACPVTLIPDAAGVTVRWERVVSGQFTLCYTVGEDVYKKTIVAESLY